MKKKELESYSILNDDELIIKPNSITYLEISTDFRNSIVYGIKI